MTEHCPDTLQTRCKTIKYSPAESEGPWKGSRIILGRLLGGSSAMALFTKRKPS